MASAMISKRGPGEPAIPPLHYSEEDPAWAMSHALWNHQQEFDSRLHQERDLLYPRDREDEEASRREWVLGQCFALLEELAELLEAREAQNPEEETVDTLHFVLSLAEKLGVAPHDLGRFEERFEDAAEEAGDRPWEEVLHDVLPQYVLALSALKGAHFKWWRAQPEEPGWAAQTDALRRIDHLNMMVASRVFPDARSMFDQYVHKVQQNHARQRGSVVGRESYRP